MSERHLMRTPRKAKVKDGITRDAWWYEEKGGITVCVEYLDSSGNVAVSQVFITAKQLDSYFYRLAKI